VVDHPEAFSKVADGDGNLYSLVEGANEFDPNIGYGNLCFYLNAPWEVVSFTGPNGKAINKNPITKAYVIEYDSNTTGTYTVVTNNPEAVDPDQTYITLNIDNPEAVSVQAVYNDVDVVDIQLQQGDNKIETTERGMFVVKAVSPWVIESAEGLTPPNSMIKGYYLYFEAGKTGTYTITTKDPTSETPCITLNVDHPEAVMVYVEYDDPDATVLEPEIVAGPNMFETKYSGRLIIYPLAPWTIESVEGLNLQEGSCGVVFEAGATDTYSITTKISEAESTFITLNVDHPEAVTVEVMDIEPKTIQPQDGVYKIDTADAGILYVTPVASWIITSAEGLTKDEATGAYSVDFEAGATDTYTITTAQEMTGPYITVNVDNLEAITVTVQYTGEESQTVEPVNGAYKIDTTKAGTLTIDKVYPWDIVDADGLKAHWRIAGRYYVDFQAGATNTYNITTKNTLEGATKIIVNVDNPEAVNVTVMYNNGNETTIDVKAGVGEVPTAQGGRLTVSPNENWVIENVTGIGFQQNGSSWELHFESGEEGTYTVSTTVTGVDSIFGDEVIETAVFNLQGIKVADTTENLPAGFYIVAGKKVMVKK